MSTPPPPHSGLPRFFLDRNLGRYAVPQGLREAGLDVIALAERYGVPQDERITDVQWMRDAAEHGEAVLMCTTPSARRTPKSAGCSPK